MTKTSFFEGKFMVFQESETCELKVTVVDDIKKEMKPAPCK